MAQRRLLDPRWSIRVELRLSFGPSGETGLARVFGALGRCLIGDRPGSAAAGQTPPARRAARAGDRLLFHVGAGEVCDSIEYGLALTGVVAGVHDARPRTVRRTS